MISPPKKRLWIAALAPVLALSSVVQAQGTGTAAPEPMHVDSCITAALRQVSTERIRANIEKLASFLGFKFSPYPAGGALAGTLSLGIYC